jgi:CHAT domain-containing protein/tetratricopeptide (TPR) repeat protein
VKSGITSARHSSETSYSLQATAISICLFCVFSSRPDAWGNPRSTNQSARVIPTRFVAETFRIGVQDRQEENRGSAEKLLGEGDKLRSQGSAESLRQALAKYEAALSLWRANSDPGGEAKALDALGLVYSLLGENQKALEYYNKALTLWRSARDQRGEGRTLHNLAFVYLNTADREKALTYLNEALPLRRGADDQDGEAATLNAFGVLYHGLAETSKAIDYFQQSLTLRRSLGDKQGEAQSVNNIGAIYFELGENEKALEYYQQALPLRRATGDKRGEANTLYNIGGVYSRLDEFQKALEQFNQSLPIWRATGDRRGEAITLNSIGALYSHLDDRQKAISYYDLALPLFRAISDRRGEAQALDNIGLIRARSGDAQQALAHFAQSLPLRRASKDRRGEAFTLSCFGGIYFSRGDLTKALEYHQQALALRQAVGERGPLATTLNQLGAIFASLGEAEKAADYYRRGLELWREVGNRSGKAASLAGLARVDRDRGNLSRAREEIEAALTEVEMLRSKTTDLDSRATLFASKQDLYEFYVNLLMDLHREQPGAGLDGEAFQAAERTRARNWLETFNETRGNIRAGVDAELLQREQRLARQLDTQAEHLARLPVNSSTQIKTAELKRNLDGLLTEYQETQAQIRARSPDYAALVQPQPVRVKELQQQVLDDRSVLLAYSLGQNQSFLWSVTKTSLQSFTLPGRSAVGKAARRFYELLTERNVSPAGETLLQKQVRLRQADDELKEASAALSQMLIAPVASQLIDKQRLLIVAEGPLLYVPFGALAAPSLQKSEIDSVNSKSTRARKRIPVPGRSLAALTMPTPRLSGSRLLILDHEIISLPSASVLEVLKRDENNRSKASKLLAVIADPVFEKDDPRVRQNLGAMLPIAADSNVTPAMPESGLLNFTRLRFSRQEAADIAALAPAATSFKAQDFAANREVIRSAGLGQYRLIHFATHTLNNNDHPELSGIVLSLVDEQGRTRDGFIRLHEIYNLRLNADLVVLSSCQTALGKEIKGEGIIGLTRGFMYAGAHRVVASLWSVQDKATSELMTNFYRNLLKKKLPPGAALREAQLSMLQTARWGSPYYWAAFSLHGMW